jgi:hypothetical protein
MSSCFKVYKISDLPKKYLDIYRKRLTNEHMLITELYDYNSYQVELFFENCKDLLTCFNKILVNIKYPLNYYCRDVDDVYYRYGTYLPTIFDTIYLVNLYNLKDFWKKCSETCRDGYGDCEDTSALTHCLFLRNQVDSFHCFGLVYKVVDDEKKLLGGHSFVIARIDTNYRLIETTLDEPVDSFSIFPVYDFTKPYIKFGDYIYYIVFMIHNKSELWINTEYFRNNTELLYEDIAELHEKEILRFEKFKRRRFKNLI